VCSILPLVVEKKGWAGANPGNPILILKIKNAF
jgi:hypothetical protein